MGFNTGYNQPAQTTVSFPDYMAHHNFEAVNSFLVGEGMQPSASKSQLGGRVGLYLKKNKEEGLKKIMHLHPDREMLESTFAPKVQPGNFNNFSGNQGGFHNCSGCNSTFSNCSGCGGGCGGSKSYSNASGSGAAVAGMNTEKTLNTLAIVAVVGILFLAAIRNN